MAGRVTDSPRFLFGFPLNQLANGLSSLTGNVFARVLFPHCS